MNDRVALLTPAVQPAPSFPKAAAITLGCAVVLCLPLAPDQPLPLAVLFGVAYAVALLAAWSIAAWAEEFLFLHYAQRTPVKRLLVAFAVPMVAPLLSIPLALLGAPLAAIGDEGVVALTLLTGTWWFGLAGVGSVVVLLLDVSASALAQKFRARLILAILGLALAVGMLFTLITSAGNRLVEALLASVGPDTKWELNVNGDPIHAAAADLIGPAEAEIIRTLLWCIAALFSLPIILSATAKLADAIMERLHPLARGFRAIEQGELGVRVEEAGSEDFVALNRSFNTMVSSLALSWRMERAFGLYVGKHVLGRIRAQHGEASVPAAQKQATVVFGDIRGFTAMSEQLQPAEVLGILNRYFGRVVTIIDEHEGFLNKFVGDAVVVVFNGPLDQTDHAERAARCAIAIQREVEQMNREGAFKEVGGLKVGIGIATGPVVAGNLGGAQQMEYTVIGDTVNLAARLTSKAPGGEVWINETMTLALPTELATEPLEPMNVKGKAKPVTPYRLWPTKTAAAPASS